jgi:molecular chaperone GrpE
MAEKENLEKDEMTNNQATSEEQMEETKAQENKAEETKEEISQEEKLRREVEELKDKHLRLYSEFENYRRRTSKERLDLIKTASEDVLADIIPVVDDFERAIKASQSEESVATVTEGNLLIYNKLLKILGNKGLKPMEDLIGKDFDADTQEAITQIPAPSDELKGKVIDVVEKGYTLGDKVVRYAKVVIGS